MLHELREAVLRQAEPPAVPTELTSWKEIAEFLGVAERTAQKWEAERGLPVKRLPGAKGRVWADPATLLEWKKTTLAAPKWYNNLKFLRYYAIGSTIAAVVLGVLAVAPHLGRFSPPAPAAYRLEFNTLIVSDAAGQELWRKVFPAPFFMPRYSATLVPGGTAAWFGDLEQDGELEVVFAYQPGNGSGGAAVICFRADGSERWRYEAHEPGLMAGGGPAWVTADDFKVADVNGDGRKETLVALSWVGTRQSRLAVLNADGSRSAEYAHVGRLAAVEVADVDGDGALDVLAGGISAVADSAALLVLDARDLTQARAILAFPRTCINQRLAAMNRVSWMRRDDDGITVTVVELEREPQQAVTYKLTRALTLRSVQPSDQFRTHHQQLEAQGTLDHPLNDQDLERLRPKLLPASAVTEHSRRWSGGSGG